MHLGAIRRRLISKAILHDPSALTMRVFWLLMLGFLIEACKLIFSR